MTATPASSRKPAKSNTGNSAAHATAKQLSVDIIAALGPSGIISEYSSHGVRFAGDIRSNGVIECYGALRETDNDSKPSAYVDTTTGKYKDSGGTETREIDLWEFVARKTGGDWLAVKKGLAERLGLAGVGGNKTTSGKRSHKKKSTGKPTTIDPAVAEQQRTAKEGPPTSRKPSESPATALGFEDWTPGKLRLLSYWCLKYRRGISPDAVLAAGGRIAKYPLGRTNNATGEAIDVPTDYVVAVPVYGEPVVEQTTEGLAGDGNVTAAATATAMLAAGPTAYVIWKLNGKPFAIYRGKDEKGEPIYDAAKMKSIGSTDGVIGEHGLRVLANHDVAAAGPLTILKPEGPTDLLAAFTAQAATTDPDATRTATPILAFAGTAKQANPWMAALFTGHNAVVVHDADRTGEAGVIKACNLLATTAASTINVKLPYDIAEKSGPDLRDWLNDGGTWADFEGFMLFGEPWVVVKDDGQADGTDADDLEPGADVDPDNPQASSPAEPDFKPLEVADDPHRLARTYIQNHASIKDFGSTLRYWREEWHQWHGREYRLVPEYELSSKLNLATKEEFDRLNIIAQEIFAERTDVQEGEDPPTARKVSRTLISDVNAAMKGMCLLSSEENAPFWIDGKGVHPADEIFATGSGLIHLPSLTDGKPNNLIPNTPNFFSPNAVSYRFPDDDPNKCEPPVEWLTFLRTLWGDDHESISLLQEWFGYCLLPDTKQEKIMLIIGPPRSGKGTITRVLSQLVGERNVDSPKLGQFDKEYGLWSLLGKTVAIVEDARLSGRHNAAEIVESLLLISGRGRANVARKFLSTLNVALPVRFTIVSNELPALNDPSGAFASRCLLLQTHQSFLGKEDKTLSARLEPELPGILIWAIQGWARLRERGYFELPSSSQEMIDDLYTLTSPAKAFIEECCNIGPGLECAPQVVYDAYREWCKEQGKKPEVSQLFGRNLKAALPHLNTEQRWNGGRKGRVYVGMTVKPALT